DAELYLCSWNSAAAGFVCSHEGDIICLIPKNYLRRHLQINSCGYPAIDDRERLRRTRTCSVSLGQWQIRRLNLIGADRKAIERVFCAAVNQGMREGAVAAEAEVRGAARHAAICAGYRDGNACALVALGDRSR